MLVGQDLKHVATAITSPSVKLLFDHWHAVRGDRLMPAWRDIDALVVAPIMPVLWSWKYQRADNSFIGRLAGEEINAILGKSMRGARMEDFYKGCDLERLFQRHWRVVCDPCIVLCHGLIFSHVDRQGVGERIMLPLAEDGRLGDGLIGATVYDLIRPVDCVHDMAAVAPMSRLSEDVRYFPLHHNENPEQPH